MQPHGGCATKSSGFNPRKAKLPKRWASHLTHLTDESTNAEVNYLAFSNVRVQTQAMEVGAVFNHHGTSDKSWFNI